MKHARSPGSLPILLADDEPLIRRAIARALEARGHEVLVASNASEAAALLDHHVIRAAAIDVRMPGGGLPVARRLVNDPTFHGPLILMTGGLAADTALQLGPAVSRLQKPFEYGDLVALLEEGIERAHGGPSIIGREGSEGHLRGAPAHIRRAQSGRRA